MNSAGRNIAGWLGLGLILWGGVHLIHTYLRPIGRAEELPAFAEPPTTAESETQPASPPVGKWTPPTFQARQKDRAKMTAYMRRVYGFKDSNVERAMKNVPRHEFVPGRLSRRAYADTPLPIGYGQTISQPYIVAEMTRRLKLSPDARVLEIGTGSGYQAAVLSHFTPHVYSIEIIKPLHDAAARRHKRLGYDAVKLRHADGYFGWADKGPFDAIIVTCAAGQIPPPLLKQLAPGGRMIIPVGGRFATQHLMLVTKDKKGKIRSRTIMAVRFVPLTRANIAPKASK